MLQIYMLYMGAMTEPVYIAIKKSGLLELLRLMLQPYLVECRHDFVTSGKMVYITEDEKESVIIQDGSSTLHVDKAHVVLELQKLFVKKMQLKAGYYFLHGAVISYNNKGILLLGKSGAGKSTLTAYLCSNGFQYVSDDKVIISGITNEVYPFTRLIQLREDVLDILHKRHVYLETIDVDLYEYKRKSVINIIPKKVDQIDMVIALARKTDICECAIRRMSGSDAIQALLWNGYSTNNIRENIDMAISLSRKIPAYFMEYYNMEDACENLCRMCE